MHASLERIFAQLEQQRHTIIDSVRHLSSERFNISLDNKWSVNQILSHIVAAERLSFQYIKKKYLGVDSIDNSGILEDGKLLLLKISQRIPGLKFQAPRVVVENTTKFVDLETLESEWKAVRNELKDFLDSIPEEHIKKKIYRHVRVGYLNIKHALIFFGEHIIHHSPQIRKLL